MMAGIGYVCTAMADYMCISFIHRKYEKKKNRNQNAEFMYFHIFV